MKALLVKLVAEAVQSFTFKEPGCCSGVDGTVFLL